MNTLKYLKMLKNEIHSTVMATLDEKGLPVTRVVDIMLADEKGIYFITAKGKEFYRQLNENNFIALSGVTEGESSINKKAISIRGRVECIGSQRLDEVFSENKYMAEIYKSEESRSALEVFRLYEGEGEFFDLSAKPIFRESFVIGKGQIKEHNTYSINNNCVGCGMCVPKCPQSCIDTGSLPYKIKSENCLHCGNCYEVCKFNAIERL